MHIVCRIRSLALPASARILWLVSPWPVRNWCGPCCRCSRGIDCHLVMTHPRWGWHVSRETNGTNQAAPQHNSCIHRSISGIRSAKEERKWQPNERSSDECSLCEISYERKVIWSPVNKHLRCETDTHASGNEIKFQGKMHLHEGQLSLLLRYEPRQKKNIWSIMFDVRISESLRLGPKLSRKMTLTGMLMQNGNRK